MRTSITKSLLCISLGIVINGCNNGNSSTSPTSQQLSNQVVNIDASQLQQIASPNIINSTNSNLKSATTNCLTGSNLIFSPSSSVWYMSGSFQINNVCSSPQQINGTEVQLTGGKATDTWTGGEFKINSFTPWLGNSPSYTISTNNNQLFAKINNSYVLGANQSIVVNYGYSRNNKPLTTAGATVGVTGSNTPPPTPTPVNNSALEISINSSALNSICNTTTPCSIAVNLLASNGSIYKTITTLISNTVNKTYNLTDIVPGSYSLSTSNLPNKAAVTFTPANLQFSAGVTSKATANFNVTNPVSSCLSTEMGALNSSAWWLSGSFTINNNCNTTQALSGTTIAIGSSDTSDIISNLQINSTTPYIANFASIINNSNAALLTINNNAGSIPANGSLIVSFGYSPQGKLLKGNLLATIDGATPVANAALSVTVDSSALINYCSIAKPCNIPVVLQNQAGSFSKLLTTITTTVGKTTFDISNLNSGTYIVISNNLPNDLIVGYAPSASLQIGNDESKNLSITYAPKPATNGTLNFSLTNPQSNVFILESLPVTIASSTGSNSGLNVKFGTPVDTSLAAGSYTISMPGLASVSKGIYYKYPSLNTTINVGGTANLGNISAALESNLVSNTITINGLKKNDSVTLVFADNKHIFNQEIVIAKEESLPIISSFKFVSNDSVTLNVITSNAYQSVAPVTLTITPNQNYIINLNKVTQPTQQIVGYFETWMATATWESATYSISKVPSYVGIIPLAFAKPDSVYTAGSYNFRGAGLDITATKDVTLGAIKLAQAKGQKLLLSVGGATYPNFAAINIPALMALVKDLNLDGIDLDYEADTNGCSNLNTSNLNCPTDGQMINIINQLRTGLDQIQGNTGKKMYLTAAVWSIGAYGTPNYPTTQYGPVGNKSALWVNPLKQVGTKFDMLFLMSYDAGNATTTGYRPLDALKAYKNIYAGPIYLGVEVPPEAWGGNVSTPQEAVTNATTAAQLGGAGTMIWALQVQGTANGSAVNSMSYLQPICRLYNLGNCDAPIPLN